MDRARAQPMEDRPMSFVKHQETVELKLNLTVSRRTKNQLEILRRAFERPVQEVAQRAIEARSRPNSTRMAAIDLARRCLRTW